LKPPRLIGRRCSDRGRLSGWWYKLAGWNVEDLAVGSVVVESAGWVSTPQSLHIIAPKTDDPSVKTIRQAFTNVTVSVPVRTFKFKVALG
jgi:hypothetical protein